MPCSILDHDRVVKIIWADDDFDMFIHNQATEKK